MATADRPVLLELPATTALLRVARVAVASLAAELPFTLQDIDDLRVAVDELAAVAIEGCGAEDRLELRMWLDREAVEVEGRVRGAGPVPELHPVARDLLDLVAPGAVLGVDGEDRTFRFAKRPQVHAS